MIAWYVHHHGRGHLTRLLAVRPHVRDEVVVLSSLPAPDPLPARTRWVPLPMDDAVEDGRDPAASDPTAGGLLHWVPLHHAGHAARMATIAATLQTADVVVVDVSVEVTVLARLLGRRVVLVTQPGERTDPAHAMGRALADVVIAPWPATDDAAIDVHHVGGISRFEGRARLGAREPATVLALGGGTSDGEWQAMVERARAATPHWRWSVAGPGRWLDDPWHALTTADVVVSAAGQNAVADLAAAHAHAVVVPRPRPFDEQHATAARLAADGLAVVADAATTSWPALLAQASASRPDWSRWRVEGAAARAATAIERAARVPA